MVTLNDLERRNGRYFALFQRIPVASGAHCVKVHVRHLISWWVLVFNRYQPFVLCSERNDAEAARRRRGSEVRRRLRPLQTDIPATRAIASRQIRETARDRVRSVRTELWRRTETRNSALPRPEGRTLWKILSKFYQMLTIITNRYRYGRDSLLCCRALRDLQLLMLCAGKRRTWDSTPERQGKRKRGGKV